VIHILASGRGQEKIKVAIDPVTRIEGHLKVEVEIKDGVVADARVFGGMYRGFEQILTGRDPRDATQITQRICGVCPTAHATALALDDAFNVKLTRNGRPHAGGPLARMWTTNPELSKIGRETLGVKKNA